MGCSAYEMASICLLFRSSLRIFAPNTCDLAGYALAFAAFATELTALFAGLSPAGFGFLNSSPAFASNSVWNFLDLS